MQAVEPRTFRWTREEFYRLLGWGCFDGRRVELLDGEIMEMAAQTNLHLAALTLVADALRPAFGPGYWVRVQGTLDLSPHSVPDPDVAVVEGDPRRPSPDNPTFALLIVEVSNTTLDYDRGRKLDVYAAASIADYWIVNLVDGHLEVYRNPAPDPARSLGFGYAAAATLKPGATVAPLAAPQAVIAVADLFP
jgi:Uma2 family endonuclease